MPDNLLHYTLDDCYCQHFESLQTDNSAFIHKVTTMHWILLFYMTKGGTFCYNF